MTTSVLLFAFAALCFALAAIINRSLRHRKYRYFVSYRIFNNGIEERGGYRIVQTRQSPSKLNDEMFTAIGKAMGIELPLEILFTGCSRLV